MQIREHREAINAAVEHMIEDLTEILSAINDKTQNRLAEMRNLVTAKKRAMDFVQQAHLVFTHLVALKYIGLEAGKKPREGAPPRALEGFFEKHPL